MTPPPDPCVLDASAMLAMLFAETGGAVVAARVRHAAISAVNWAEVVQRVLAEHGLGADAGRHAAVRAARVRLEAVGVRIEPFLPEDAEAAAMLRESTGAVGLSLGDRACLALSGRLGVPAVTADRAWASLPASIGVEIEMIG